MLKNWLIYLNNWENWHWLVKYIPIVPSWCWYCLKSGSFWFFTSSNPTLTFGGFIGETKKEMYAQLPAETIPNSAYIDAHCPMEEVIRKFREGGFTYPVAVKPDAGMMGFMFRKITSEKNLGAYHQAMTVDYILQDYIDYPFEVSVFYYRFPDREQGTITGFLRKEYLQVTGDGHSTLHELIKNYERVQLRLEEMKRKHSKRLNTIIPDGERVCLSPALNLSRGGKLVSLALEKDKALLRVFDNLSHYNQSFFYGRYDIKCRSIEDLKAGKNFSILEYNGSGAEPHHIYGNGYSLFQAYEILLHHWKVLYEISKINRARGVSSWNFFRGMRYTLKVRQYFKQLSQLDANYQC